MGILVLVVSFVSELRIEGELACGMEKQNHFSMTILSTGKVPIPRLYN